jgi:uncharacterized protein
VTEVIDPPDLRVPDSDESFETLRHAIEHAAHLLPSQGPITVFVHHNTLHAFEDLPFDAGVKAGAQVFGCNPYLPEDRYRQKLERGRIRVEDLEAVLLDDLGDEADRLVAKFGTRYALRLAMLQFPLHSGPSAELRWTVAETAALRRFREEVDHAVRDATIEQTRHWAMRDLRNGGPENERTARVLNGLIDQFGRASIQSWSERKWEAFTLQLLWRACREGVTTIARNASEATPTVARSASKETPTRGTPSAEDNTALLAQRANVASKRVRHRDALLTATGYDTDVCVNEILIPLCAAFLDQGFADSPLGERDEGLFASFLRLYRYGYAPSRWLGRLKQEASRLSCSGMSPLQSIAESFELLGVSDDEHDEFITQTLLALRGYAGMVWQMETNAEWAPHPAPTGSLIEFLAVRLVLDRLAIEDTDVAVADIRTHEQPNVTEVQSDVTDRRTFTVFQLAQVRGWKPLELIDLSPEQWTTLVGEIESFDNLERRRVYHLAFERKYRNETLDAVATHSARVRQQKPEALARDTNAASEDDGSHSTILAGASGDSDSSSTTPAYQVVCCIDDREESFRRHLEEFDRQCETLGVAGFFGVAMYYRGVADAHFTPLCPVNIKPQHYVIEESLYSTAGAERRRSRARQRIGRATHEAHLGSRSFLAGFVTTLVGSLAAFPIVARILFPRTTARLRRLVSGIVQPPGTQLRIERLDAEPGSSNGQLGYSLEEMANIVEGGLRAIGLGRTDRFSPLVVICGHGSSSLNNPHEAAHDCGACGGGRGGPNARAFAQMANDLRVRRLVESRGLAIPDSTYFVGCYHNTCDDSVNWYDMDRIPVAQRELFERSRDSIDEARRRSAHERCRRFESAELSLSVDDALRHVEGRAEDLSQTRPEYGHATNALCFVGPRNWSRGLFLDRRSFLTSYDPAQDDERSSILERLLQAVIPVCAGINLEYYFSYVDPIGYGCGTKLPHNITGLLGVMDGAASDLRPGLPWQMVEIHEPVRLLFVIESTSKAMRRIIDNNGAIAQLVNGDWVQLALLDAETSVIHRYVNGEFIVYEPEPRELPIEPSSLHWYRGWRDHLGFASIRENGAPVSANAAPSGANV